MRPGSEIAAFLVLAGDGSLRLSRWPSNATSYRETFNGTRPPGTVGLVHTHPPEWYRPSTGDIDEARRHGLPNYVISRRIRVVDPESGRSFELANPG